MTPDVAVVISLNRFMAPVDDTVTAPHKSQVTRVRAPRPRQGTPGMPGGVVTVP